ncbi:uncharacterized protein IWZ02DRAFT_495295 [Phyllosticta citriasiana]|uniref:uncharacterized protein n=1 Tax=Phyllosticta citriasiana TaxID=595635 RepID=UPI0030FD3422
MSISRTKYSREPDNTALISEAKHAKWRGATGYEILRGQQMKWTQADRRIFCIYAARHQWCAADGEDDDDEIARPELEQLQKDIQVYTASWRLNEAIAAQLGQAVVHHLHRRVLDYFPTRNPSWPAWTCKWFLDPTWDGDMSPPGPLPSSPTPPLVAALASAWARQRQTDQQFIFAFLRRLYHDLDGDVGAREALVKLRRAVDAFIVANSKPRLVFCPAAHPGRPPVTAPTPPARVPAAKNSLSPVVEVYESAPASPCVPEAHNSISPVLHLYESAPAPPSPPAHVLVACNSISPVVHFYESAPEHGDTDNGSDGSTDSTTATDGKHSRNVDFADSSTASDDSGDHGDGLWNPINEEEPRQPWRSIFYAILKDATAPRDDSDALDLEW